MNFASNFALCAILIGRGAPSSWRRGAKSWLCRRSTPRHASRSTMRTPSGAASWINRSRALYGSSSVVSVSRPIAWHPESSATARRRSSAVLMIRYLTASIDASLTLRADQITHRLGARYKRRMDGPGGQEVAIAGPQGVFFDADSEFQRAADDPVRLILFMRVGGVASP